MLSHGRLPESPVSGPAEDHRAQPCPLSYAIEAPPCGHPIATGRAGFSYSENPCHPAPLRATPPRMDSASPPLPKRKIPRQATSEVAWEFDPVVVSDSYPLLEFPPYLHKQPRRNSITPDLQRAFVAHLAVTGIVKSAAMHIGRSLEALYKLRARPGAEGFAAAWDEALGLGGGADRGLRDRARAGRGPLQPARQFDARLHHPPAPRAICRRALRDPRPLALRTYPSRSARRFLISAAPPGCDFLAHTPCGRVAAGGRSALRSLRDRCPT